MFLVFLDEGDVDGVVDVGFQGGEVIESVPGRIRVRIGGKDVNESSALGWLIGFQRRPAIVDMELLLERNNPQQRSIQQDQI